MEKWEETIIQDTLKNSPGLLQSLKSAHEKENKALLKVSIEHLAGRAGMRVEYIEKHIEEIINL
jgi:hypothetical protein